MAFIASWPHCSGGVASMFFPRWVKKSPFCVAFPLASRYEEDNPLTSDRICSGVGFFSVLFQQAFDFVLRVMADYREGVTSNCQSEMAELALACRPVASGRIPDCIAKRMTSTHVYTVKKRIMCFLAVMVRRRKSHGALLCSVGPSLGSPWFLRIFPHPCIGPDKTEPAK